MNEEGSKSVKLIYASALVIAMPAFLFNLVILFLSRDWGNGDYGALGIIYIELMLTLPLMIISLIIFLLLRKKLQLPKPKWIHYFGIVLINFIGIDLLFILFVLPMWLYFV